MKRLLSLSLAAMLIALAANAAFAQESRYGSNLTPEQAAKMEQFCAESRAAMKPIRQQIHAKRAELNEQINSTVPDKGKMETLAKELGALQGKLYLERANVNVKLIKEGLPAKLDGRCGPGKGKNADGRGAKAGKKRG